MSLMEKRLQLLLDAHRWELVSTEAERTHRSVASVIRQSIDLYFASEEQDALRAQAATRFLVLTAEAPADEVGLGPAEIRAEQEAEDAAAWERVTAR